MGEPFPTLFRVAAETFFGLTAMQLQGWAAVVTGFAAIVSLGLTAALVWTTIRYVRLTKEIATAARQSHQHEVDAVREKSDRERAIVLMMIQSMIVNLQQMGGRNLANEAVTRTLPERVPGLRMPEEVLLGYARGISAEVCLKVGTMLFDLHAGEESMRQMAHAPPDLGVLRQLGDATQRHFQSALTNTTECRSLL